MSIMFSDINVTPNTLFAPTNDAFRKLPNDTMDIIRKNQQYCERKHVTAMENAPDYVLSSFS